MSKGQLDKLTEDLIQKGGSVNDEAGSQRECK